MSATQTENVNSRNAIVCEPSPMRSRPKEATRLKPLATLRTRLEYWKFLAASRRSVRWRSASTMRATRYGRRRCSCTALTSRPCGESVASEPSSSDEKLPGRCCSEVEAPSFSPVHQHLCAERRRLPRRHNGDGNSFAHNRQSHETKSSETPFRTLPLGVIH